MKFRFLKYSPILVDLILGVWCMNMGGWYVWIFPLFVFGMIPLLELVIPASQKNLSKAEEEIEKADKTYDYMLYLMVPIQYGMLAFFLFLMKTDEQTPIEMAGRIFGMGISCGVLGINVAHELGHRKNKFEQFLSKTLLLSSLYMHFFIEHNRGHHKRVSTPDDPASSRYGEIIYLFYIRSVFTGFMSAWNLETKRLKKANRPVLSFKNQMIQFMLIQGSFILAIGVLVGWMPMLAFIAAATVGFLMLETVNYIEHYGLQRKRKSDGVYERVLPEHSWNSNHFLGRVMLFELSRHSDHHFIASRKYQILRHIDGSPQMPTGYPGMMVLALIPPIWFWVMHRRIRKYQSELAVEEPIIAV